MVWLAGSRLMEVSTTTGAVTFSRAVFVLPLSDAVIVVVPWAAEVASPDALMVATPWLEELQLTEEVMFFDDPSL